jgi:hypothetical protein
LYRRLAFATAKHSRSDHKDSPLRITVTCLCFLSLLVIVSVALLLPFLHWCAEFDGNVLPDSMRLGEIRWANVTQMHICEPPSRPIRDQGQVLGERPSPCSAIRAWLGRPRPDRDTRTRMRLVTTPSRLSCNAGGNHVAAKSIFPARGDDHRRYAELGSHLNEGEMAGWR